MYAATGVRGPARQGTCRAPVATPTGRRGPCDPDRVHASTCTAHEYMPALAPSLALPCLVAAVSPS